MRNLLFYFAITLVIASCQTNKKEQATDTKAEKNAQQTDVKINYDTDTGIPEFSATSTEAVSLNYKFKHGDSTHVMMDYIMDVEMMGQKMPMTMIMESKSKVNKITDAGNAAMDVWFTRLAMTIEGPQPMKFDTDKDKNLDNNPMTANLQKLLNHKIKTVVTPKGKIIDFNVDALLNDLTQDNPNKISQQMRSMAGQYPQNTFITLPQKKVKEGDRFDAGSIKSGSIGMNMNIEMKYNVLKVGAGKRYVLLGIDGQFQMNASQEGIEMNSSGNEIKGWIVFDRKKGMVMRNKRTMDMNVTTSQAGVMKITVTVETKIK